MKLSLLTFVATTYASTTCYVGSTDYSATITRTGAGMSAATCSGNEVCMTKMIKHKNGKRGFTGSCATQAVCQESGKNNDYECRFGKYGRRLSAQCWSCCTGASCNAIQLTDIQTTAGGGDFTINTIAP